MDSTKEEPIYNKFLSYIDKALLISIEDNNRSEFARLSIRSYRDIIKIYGSESDISKKFHKYVNSFRFNSKLSKNEVKNFIEELKMFSRLLSEFDQKENTSITSKASLIPNSKNIFIIHGHDKTNTLILYNMLKEEFNLNPIKIVNKPGQSQSIIDKFEKNASACSFAFALFTKDDEVNKSNDKYFQARPNVIFEAGWFTGRIGKNRLVILLQNGTKIHSDFEGISRIQFNNDVEEKFIEIKKELIAANLV